MVMHSGRGDFNAKRSPILQDVNTGDVLQKLIHTDQEDEQTTVFNFRDEAQAFDFAKTIFKARKHGSWSLELKYFLMAKAQCAIKGERAKLVSMTAMRVAVPEAYGGKSDAGNRATENK